MPRFRSPTEPGPWITFNIQVVSDFFKGKNLLDRHRMIYQALDEPMKDGRIHASGNSSQNARRNITGRKSYYILNLHVVPGV